ncbi:hypothetical protein ES703_122511 [subsurface metagenome]
MNNEEWVEFAKKDPVEAEIIRGKLEAYGIEVYLKQDAFGKIAAITTDGLGEVKILVHKDKLEEAREIIEEE